MLDKNGRPITIVVADDDPDDRMMIEEAFEENRLKNNLAFVEDGEQLIDYLRGEGAYADNDRRNPIGVILLDLNMPRMDGREALKIIKSDPELHRIPVGRPDHIQSRRGHSANLRPGCQLVYHKTGDLRRTGGCGQSYRTVLV